MGLGNRQSVFVSLPPFIKFYIRYSLFLQYFILIKYMYMYYIIYQQSKKKVMCDAICVDMIIFCDMTIYEYTQMKYSAI